jgi:diguanylate cyclase (GGDEF)-like protein
MRTALLVVIGALVARVRQLQRLRMTDARTGLLTPVAWETLAGRGLAQARRRHASIALMVLDVDGFKRVNDLRGHRHGDAALTQVGRRLATGLRGYDVVGRYGGDEFAALLIDVSRADAALIVERLRSSVAADGQVTVSIGVVAANASPDVALDDLIDRADAALRQAKSAGGDRVAVSD